MRAFNILTAGPNSEHSIAVPQDPIKLHQVLATEYQTLRPGSDFASAGEAELFARLHRHEQPLSALCISGGGIRNATFALGAIQGLAGHGLLGRFDYLSTVSGGGYIGGWLSAWIQRFGGVEHVIPHLRPDAARPQPGEPDPVDHLREYNNYLSPRLGFFSADTWTLAATVGRNILLNWLVLIRTARRGVLRRRLPRGPPPEHRRPVVQRVPNRELPHARPAHRG